MEVAINNFDVLTSSNTLESFHLGCVALSGSHTGEAIAGLITSTLIKHDLSAAELGAYISDNGGGIPAGARHLYGGGPPQGPCMMHLIETVEGHATGERSGLNNTEGSADFSAIIRKCKALVAGINKSNLKTEAVQKLAADLKVLAAADSGDSSSTPDARRISLPGKTRVSGVTTMVKGLLNQKPIFDNISLSTDPSLETLRASIPSIAEWHVLQTAYTFFLEPLRIVKVRVACARSESFLHCLPPPSRAAPVHSFLPPPHLPYTRTAVFTGFPFPTIPSKRARQPAPQR